MSIEQTVAAAKDLASLLLLEMLKKLEHDYSKQRVILHQTQAAAFTKHSSFLSIFFGSNKKLFFSFELFV